MTVSNGLQRLRSDEQLLYLTYPLAFNPLLPTVNVLVLSDFKAITGPRN